MTRANGRSEQPLSSSPSILLLSSPLLFYGNIDSKSLARSMDRSQTLYHSFALHLPQKPSSILGGLKEGSPESLLLRFGACLVVLVFFFLVEGMFESPTKWYKGQLAPVR
jgi:hypothetical protein